MQSGSGFILGRWLDIPDLTSLTATASKGVIRNQAGTAWEMRPFALTDQATVFSNTVTATGLVASSSAVGGNNIQLTNTSTGGHSFQIFTGGQTNLPGMFGIYDVTGSVTFFVADPGTSYNLRVLSGAQIGWSSSSTLANNSADTGMARTGAAAIKFTDGSTGFASAAAKSLSLTFGTAATGSAISFTGTWNPSSGTSQPVLINPTYNQTSTAAATDLTINRVETAVGSGAQLFLDCQVGGSSKFNIDHAGNVTAQAITNTGNITSTLSASGWVKLVANGNASYLQCAYSNLLLNSNAIFNGSSWVYDINGSAASIAVATSTTPTMAFNVAASGTGGAAITWTSQIQISTVGIGFYGTSPVAKPSTTGTTAGFTASTGTTVVSGSTFTGNTGSTAYTIGDIVNALKKLGLLTA